MSQITAAGKRISEVLLPFCIYYLVNSIIITLGFTFLESRKQVLQLTVAGSSAEILLQALVRMVAFLAAALAILSEYRKEKYLAGTYEMRQLSFKSIIILFVTGAILALLLNLIWFQIPFLAENEAYQRVAANQHSYPLWLALPLYGIFSPLAEELLFRGIIFSRIRRCLSVFPAILISSFLFGIFHGNPVQAAYGMVMGVALAYIYHKFNTMNSVFLFHSGANIAVCLFTVISSYS